MKQKAKLRELEPQLKNEVSKEIFGELTSKKNKMDFLSYDPKDVTEIDPVDENELGGIRFKVSGNFFKGRVEIIKSVTGFFNIKFWKFSKGKYSIFAQVYEIKEEEFITELNYIEFGDEDISEVVTNNPIPKVKSTFSIKKGDKILLKDGMVGIILSYYSNSKIGITLDDEVKEIQREITKDDIEKVL